MTAATTGQRAAGIGGVVGFLVVMELGSGMLQGWYPPLLSAIGTEFGANAALLNWVSAGYLLATVVFVPVIGKLGDRFGHKRMLTICAAMAIIMPVGLPRLSSRAKAGSSSTRWSMQH